MAAGVTVARENIDQLRAFLERRLARAVELARGKSELKIDGVLTAGGATEDLARLLDQAGPYGTGHPQPVFALPAHQIRSARIVGSGHVRATLATAGGASVNAIAFRSAERPLGRQLLDAGGRPLHVAGSLELNYWQGRARPQIRILDAADPGRTVA